MAKPSTCDCAASNCLTPCIDAVMTCGSASVVAVLQWLINHHTQILWLEPSFLCLQTCCLCPWLIARAATIADDPTGSCSSNRRRRRTRRCSTRFRNSCNSKRNSCSNRSNNRQALTARALRSRCRVYCQGEPTRNVDGVHDAIHWMIAQP